MRRNDDGDIITKAGDVEVTIDDYWVNFREERRDGYHLLSIPIKAYERIYKAYLKEQGYTMKKMKIKEEKNE